MLQGAALGAMVGQMTYGKRQFESLDGVMRRLIPPFHQAVEELLLMVDADSSAFNSYMVRRATWFTEHICNVDFYVQNLKLYCLPHIAAGGT